MKKKKLKRQNFAHLLIHIFLDHYSGAGFSALTSLQNLELQDNGINILTNGYFTHIRNIPLQTINLVANGITKIQRQVFNDLPSVVSVILNLNDFSNTDIEESLYGINKTNISSLLLECNTNLITITNSTFKYLRGTELKSLDLGYIGLVRVSDNAFNNITTLETIRMNSNSFTELSNHVFSWLPALKNVYLNYNPQLTHLNR